MAQRKKTLSSEVKVKEEKRDCKEHRWIPLLGSDGNKTVQTFLFTCVNCGDLKVGTQTIKISRFRMDMGELPINSVAGINLMNPPTDDSTASGLIISGTSAVACSVGDALFMNSSGQFQLADASTSATSPCVGLALDATSGGAIRVLLHGVMKHTPWPNWTTGPGTLGLIYLDITAGDLTHTRPSATNEVIQPVGWALSDSHIYFCPSMMYLTHI